MIDTKAMVDELRAYVAEYGVRAAAEILAAICEETRDANLRQPEGTLASINADVLRHAMTKMVR